MGGLDQDHCSRSRTQTSLLLKQDKNKTLTKLIIDNCKKFRMHFIISIMAGLSSLELMMIVAGGHHIIDGRFR